MTRQRHNYRRPSASLGARPWNPVNYASRVERMRSELQILIRSWQEPDFGADAHEIAIFLEEETRGAEKERR